MLPLGGLIRSPHETCDLAEGNHQSDSPLLPSPIFRSPLSSRLRAAWKSRRDRQSPKDASANPRPVLTASSSQSSDSLTDNDTITLESALAGLGILDLSGEVSSLVQSSLSDCESQSSPRKDSTVATSFGTSDVGFEPWERIGERLEIHSPIVGNFCQAEDPPLARELDVDRGCMTVSSMGDSATTPVTASPRVNGDVSTRPDVLPMSDAVQATRNGSPSTPRPTTASIAAISHLSGLVANVHRTTGKEPPALVGATTTILGDHLFVLAGRRLNKSRASPSSDLYQLDLLHRHWTKVATKGDVPPSRYFHSTCALGDGKLVCYGGMSPETASPQTTGSSANPEQSEAQVSVMSDIHMYDVKTRTWTRIDSSESPQGRYAHCAAILPSGSVFASDAPRSAVRDMPTATQSEDTRGLGGAEMIIVGGQDSANRYIEQISIFNLRSLRWTSTSAMPGRSCGAYRSVITPLTSVSSQHVGTADAATLSDADVGDDASEAGAVSGSPMLMYTNYNFLDVKLELQVRSRDGRLADKTMQGSVSPPGLRFPSGGIINDHFVVSGTFLTSSKQEFALWALNLKALTWAKIDTASSIFSQGSWNRGVLWPRRNAFVILGNRKRNLVDDYNNRRLNFAHMCLVQLEAFGLYDNPQTTSPMSGYNSASTLQNMSLGNRIAGGRQLGAAAVGLGEQCRGMTDFADMDLVGIDGVRLPVSSHMMALRWGPAFGRLLESAGYGGSGDGRVASLQDLADSDLSRVSSLTITPSVNTGLSTATTLTANHAESTQGDNETEHGLTGARPRILFLPHTAPTLRTFVHYLYTSSLPRPGSPMATPQILCSLLQLARPYKVEGLLEAVIERLHQSLDGRNAAAIFNAAAMGAGGDESIVSLTDTQAHLVGKTGVSGLNGERTETTEPTASSPPGSAAGNDLRIDIGLTNGVNRGLQAGQEEDTMPNSASTIGSMNSQLSTFSQGGKNGAPREIWDGGWSAVIGLQKRGLRGLMEGRRMRERAKGTEIGSARQDTAETLNTGASSAAFVSDMPNVETGRVGLGIA